MKTTKTRRGPAHQDRLATGRLRAAQTCPLDEDASECCWTCPHRDEIPCPGERADAEKENCS